jgi:hypothetical protein
MSGRRDRRDRERAACEACGKTVTVRRDGGLMAHRANGRPCVAPAWAQRRDGLTPAPCIACGLRAAAGDVYCHGCRSARDPGAWLDGPEPLALFPVDALPGQEGRNNPT